MSPVSPISVVAVAFQPSFAASIASGAHLEQSRVPAPEAASRLAAAGFDTAQGWEKDHFFETHFGPLRQLSARLRCCLATMTQYATVLPEVNLDRVMRDAWTSDGKIPKPEDVSPVQGISVARGKQQVLWTMDDLRQTLVGPLLAGLRDMLREPAVMQEAPLVVLQGTTRGMPLLDPPFAAAFFDRVEQLSDSPVSTGYEGEYGFGALCAEINADLAQRGMPTNDHRYEGGVLLKLGPEVLARMGWEAMARHESQRVSAERSLRQLVVV